MHYAKYQKGAVGSILMHCDRGIDSPDTHEHSNDSIDSTRTHLNYDLKDRSGLSAYAYYKQRIDAIAKETKERTGKSIRKDAVTLCSWAVTVPKDLPGDKQAEFFQASYEWFAKRYGEDNIVTAAVHMDETTPHMHLQFTPIIERDGVRKLCAKELETRKTLQTAHNELQKSLQQALGCEVNILNGATNSGNKSILELQQQQIEQQKAELEQQRIIIEKQRTELADNEAAIKETTERRIASVKKIPIIGKKEKSVTIPVEEYDILTRQASRIKEVKQLEREANEQLLKAGRLIDDAQSTIDVSIKVAKNRIQKEEQMKAESKVSEELNQLRTENTKLKEQNASQNSTIEAMESTKLPNGMFFYDYFMEQKAKEERERKAKRHRGYER